MKQKLFLIILALLIASPLMAGPRWRSFINWVDSADIAGADTSYVRWPKEDLIASVNVSMIHSLLHILSEDDTFFGAEQYSGYAKSEIQVPISIRLAYRGWGLSYSRNIGNYVDNEFSFSTCGQQYSAELRYQHDRSFTGTLENGSDTKQDIDIQSGDIRQTTYYSSFSYIFNHKRFSMPAALLQTVVQRRSAGSWLASVSLMRSIQSFHGLPFDKITSTKFSIGGGYAYNFAFANEHCLLHASFVPLVNVLNHNSVFSSEGKSAASESISFNGNMNLSFVYNVSKYVMGVTSNCFLSWQDLSDYVEVVDLNWSSRVFIGVRF